MISRRRLVLALGAGALVPLAVLAQQPPAKVWRIGVISANTAAFMARRLDALRAGLAALGYVEGRNYVIEYRSAEGKDERFAGLAAELIRLNVDLIVTHGLAPIAVKQATSTIPIVVTDSGDLVAMGLAASLARPGGNLTGQIFFANELPAKRVELIKEAYPRLSQVAYLHVDNPFAAVALEKVAATAKHLKMRTQQFEVRAGETEFHDTFAAVVKQRSGGVVTGDHPTLSSGVKAIANQALKHRLPAVGNPQFAEAGGMLGYGVQFDDFWRRAAVFIDKIFKGTKPGDIAIEQPTSFELVVNLKTARALGIEIPNAFLVRATKVIE